MPRLVVFGGAGFLGKRICERAVRKGWEVTSITRSGRMPDINLQTSKLGDVSWLRTVQWKSGDVFKPETYASELKEADAVVHSMGILLETNYKAVLNSAQDPFSAVSKLLCSTINGSNPMQKGVGSTYKHLNTESAVILAEEYAKTCKDSAAPKPMLYVSADPAVSRFLPGYVQSKLEAERRLTEVKSLRTVFLRPGFMFDEQETGSSLRSQIAQGLSFGAAVGKTVFHRNGPLGFTGLDSVFQSPISTQSVATIAVQALEDDGTRGVITLDQIERFASRFA